MNAYEKDILNPLHLVQDNEEKGKEKVCKDKEHKWVVLVHWLSKRMAHTK